LKPRLVYEDEADMDAGSNTGAEIWLPQIFSVETAAQVL